MRYKKKEIAPEQVREICDRFGCDPIKASVLLRRGLSRGDDLIFFLENDLRYLHNPFLFSSMEDAVDRILAARDEGEKVLIFGDRDVDGMTSTVLLYDSLKRLGLDISWRLPAGNETYGLSRKVIDEFAAAYGSLIITVDCGISNKEEIEYAAQQSIDVIVVDHHQPPALLSEHAIIINPKLSESGYPFSDISGCAVAFKLASALRFAQTELYKQEICLLNVRPLTEAYVIEVLKMVNMAEKSRLVETIVPGMVSITQTRLPNFLQGQQIFVWDKAVQNKQLEKIFGTSVEFNLFDIRTEAAKCIPSVADTSLLKLMSLSRVLRYREESCSELDAFYNIMITFVRQKIMQDHPNFVQEEAEDIQLCMLSSLSDIMPLKNENRIFIRQGLAVLNAGRARKGLQELLVRQNLIGKRIGSSSLSWNIIPVLNASGRLGQPELTVRLFIEEDEGRRTELADQITELNKQRKQLGAEAWALAESKAIESLNRHGGKLIVIIDERIHRGVAGILASRLVQRFKVPAIAATIVEGSTVIGSMRTTRGCNATETLSQFAEFFDNYGGHTAAAGFNMKQDRLPDFTEQLAVYAPLIELKDESECEIEVDADIPPAYLTPDLLKITDELEPYGHNHPHLVFLARGLRLVGADIMGKTERQHLKLILDSGKIKWPAVYWGAAERLNRDFSVGDRMDVLFYTERNFFNGTETPQMMVIDTDKSPA